MANQQNGSSAAKSSLWKKYGLQEQLLYHQDGYVFNLSEIDWDSAKVYEYEDSNRSHTEHGIVSSGRSIALAAFALIFFVGLVGNTLVIYTVSRYVAMRQGTYLYFLNLSVTDMLYLLICLPSLSASYALVEWRFGRLFCKLDNYIMSVSMSVSVLTIVATGIDRYIAVIHPLKSRTFRTTKKTVSVIIMTWILSVIIMAPRIIIFDEVPVWHTVGPITLCSRVQTHYILQLDTTLNFIFMYLLPLLGLSVCHARIGQKLWTSRKPGIPGAQTRKIGTLLARDRRRIAMMVFAITVVFAVGWLPIHVYHLVEDFDKGNILFGEIIDRGTIALFFSFGANALNPIFYCLFSSSFRMHFRKAFECRRDRRIISINPADFGLYVPIVQVEDEGYRRPPPVLLPRPASILHSPEKLENRLVSLSPAARQTEPNEHSLKSMTHEETKHFNNFSIPYFNSSPLPAEKASSIEIFGIDAPFHSDGRKQNKDTSLFSLSVDLIQLENVKWKSIRFHRERSASLPTTIPVKSRKKSWNRSRAESSSTFSISERDDLATVTRLQKWVDTDVLHHLSQAGNTTYLEYVCRVLKHQRCQSTLFDNKIDVQCFCNNPFSLSRRRPNDTTASKSAQVCCQHLEFCKQRNLAHSQENTHNTKTIKRYAFPEKSLSMPEDKKHKCNLVSCVTIHRSPSRNDVSKRTEIKPAVCFDFDLSHEHNLVKPASNEKLRSYRACTKRMKTKRNTNSNDNLPPVN